MIFFGLTVLNIASFFIIFKTLPKPFHVGNGVFKLQALNVLFSLTSFIKSYLISIHTLIKKLILWRSFEAFYDGWQPSLKVALWKVLTFHDNTFHDGPIIHRLWKGTIFKTILIAKSSLNSIIQRRFLVNDRLWMTPFYNDH